MSFLRAVSRWVLLSKYFNYSGWTQNKHHSAVCCLLSRSVSTVATAQPLKMQTAKYLTLTIPHFTITQLYVQLIFSSIVLLFHDALYHLPTSPGIKTLWWPDSSLRFFLRPQRSQGQSSIHAEKIKQRAVVAFRIIFWKISRDRSSQIFHDFRFLHLS